MINIENHTLKSHLLLTALFLVFFFATSLQAQVKTIDGYGLKIDYELQDERHFRPLLIYPEGFDYHKKLGSGRLANQDVALHTTGNNQAALHGMLYTGGQPGVSLVLRDIKEEPTDKGKRLTVIQHDNNLQLKVESVYEFFRGTSAIRRYTRLTNESRKPIGIEYVSSAIINNFGNLGLGRFDDKVLVHWAYNTWRAEGQWKSGKPSDLGWAENGRNPLNGIFHTSLGSLSSNRELPFAMVENKAVNLTWFWQIEHSGSWHWEISGYPGDSNEGNDFITPTYVYIGGPDKRNHHAWKELRAGEVYKTVPVAIGCVEGGFDEAVEEATRYRRVACLKPHHDNEDCPVIFNDFMNCLRADPTTEKELPLIRAAAKAGADYFVMDAGWYSEPNQRWWDKVGSWQQNAERFPNGINEVFDSIRNKGMIPGIWVEIERVGSSSPLISKPDSWFFMQNGQRLHLNSSYFLDFRNPEVIKYVDEVIDRVVKEYGVGYIKMDHNSNAFLGTETKASSTGQGLLGHQRAYLNWVESIHKRYPDLVLESCASGGCRMDYAILSRKQVQSSSDQSDYRKYPAVLTGVAAAVLPEQMAVWSYPLGAGDAREASFNMVNSMVGRIHLSGELAGLSDESFVQVQKGIQIYKTEIAEIIPYSYPFFPLGMPAIQDDFSPVALGMKTENTDYYAVWRLKGDASITVPMKHNGKVELVYPDDLGIKLEKGNGVFTVKFPEEYMAVMVRVTK